MIVMKFGGTSLANQERIKNVADIVKTRLGKKPIVVVSAIAGITDKLLNLANNSAKGEDTKERLDEIISLHQEILRSLELKEDVLDKEIKELSDIIKGVYLLREISPRSLDLVVSFGERFSSMILSEYLNKQGIKSKQANGWDIGIVTDNNFVNAEILEETYNNIKEKLSSLDHVLVVTGFIAKNKEGQVTTMGRGGSDYTASIIGAALNMEEIEIWTDVNGIKTADPKIVPCAKQWDKITFNEASEMAQFGAKVLHPKTIRPAIDRNISVRVLNTYNLEGKGTAIIKEDKEECIFRTISSKNNITVLSIHSTKMLLVHGFLEKIFSILNKYELSVDLVSTSEVTVSMTLDGINGTSNNLNLVISELENLGTVTLLKERSIISIVGKDMYGKSGVLGRIFDVCKNSDINVELVSQGASHISISFVIKQEDMSTIVTALHKELFE